MGQDAKFGNAKNCGYCGKLFIPQRSTAKFCNDAHRVLALRAVKRAARLRYQSERRSGISLGFDGQITGKPRLVGHNNAVDRMTVWSTPFNANGKDMEAKGSGAEEAIRCNVGMPLRDLQLYLRERGFKRDPVWVASTYTRLEEEARSCIA